MNLFVDTSALHALLDCDDAGSATITPAWYSAIDGHEGLVTTNYVIVEAITLTQSRLGLNAVRTLMDELLPMIETIWVTESDHAAAATALLTAGRRRLSFTDCVSFVVMRRLGIREYVGLDAHFDEQGFARYGCVAPASD